MSNHIIISAYDSRENNAYTYNDIAGSTITSIRASLEDAGTTNILLRNVVSPVFFESGAFTLKPSEVDREFMDRMSGEYPVIKTLFKELVDRARTPCSPPVPKDAATEELLISIGADAEQRVITRKQLRFLNTVYGLTRSHTVITGDGKWDSGVLTGDRELAVGLTNLLSVADALCIDVDAERCGEVARIRSMADVEQVASTVSLNASGLDIITGTKTLGTGYINAQADIDKLNKNITALHRSPNFKDVLYVFSTKRMATSQMRKHTFLSFSNATWFGARKLVCHNFSAVVLAGIPKINSGTAFITDANQERSVLAYRRYHILGACGLASVVNCVGISAKWLQNVLPVIPGVIVHPPQKA